MALSFPVNTYVSGSSLDPVQTNPLSVQVDVYTDSACTSPAVVTDPYSGDDLATLTITNNRLQYFDGPDDTTFTLYIRPVGSSGVGFAVQAVPVLHSLATLADLAKRYDISDDDLAQQALDDGSALIRSAVFNEEAWPYAPGGVPNSVKVILIRAAIRWLNNPDELQNESFGSYAYSYNKEASTGIWLTDSEVTQLRRIYGASAPRSLRAVSPYTCRPFSNTVFSLTGDPDVDSRWGGAIPFFDSEDIELVADWIYPEEG